MVILDRHTQCQFERDMHLQSCPATDTTPTVNERRVCEAFSTLTTDNGRTTHTTGGSVKMHDGPDPPPTPTCAETDRQRHSQHRQRYPHAALADGTSRPWSDSPTRRATCHSRSTCTCVPIDAVDAVLCTIGITPRRAPRGLGRHRAAGPRHHHRPPSPPPHAA